MRKDWQNIHAAGKPCIMFANECIHKTMSFPHFWLHFLFTPVSICDFLLVLVALTLPLAFAIFDSTAHSVALKHFHTWTWPTRDENLFNWPSSYRDKKNDNNKCMIWMWCKLRWMCELCNLSSRFFHFPGSHQIWANSHNNWINSKYLVYTFFTQQNDD